MKQINLNEGPYASEIPDKAVVSNEKMPSFRKELETLINMHSIENGSDTPDFVLAEYLMKCLEAYEAAVTTRDRLAGG